jgi:hypothetical protein
LESDFFPLLDLNDAAIVDYQFHGTEAKALQGILHCRLPGIEFFVSTHGILSGSGVLPEGLMTGCVLEHWHQNNIQSIN